jgi:hypothetical protein
MSPHVSDSLPRLLTGDATREEVLAAAEHLRTCPDCQQELVSAVVAHSALSSAHRFAPEVVSGSTRPAGPDPEKTAPEPTPLPDLSEVFAQARAESERPAPAAKRTATRLPRRRVLLIGAAAAAVLVGGGFAIAENVGHSASSSVQTVALAAYGVGQHPGTAHIAGTTMRIDASRLPRLDDRHSYEVWLTNGARTRMVSVGFIGADNRAQLTIARNVMTQYSNIEISVQRDNQTVYSGTSVLRGAYS